MTFRLRYLSAISLGPLCLGTFGCHSAFVQTTVLNQTGQSLRLFEVDYPSASFGGGELPNGRSFRYRFKILGAGPVKITWTDTDAHEHTSQGPTLTEGQEGTLSIILKPDAPEWNAKLSQVH